MIIIVLQTISQINIRQSASKTASVVCTVPANTDVEIVGVKIIWKDNIPFVKISYKGKRGFTNGRYLRGLVLKVKNRDSAKYPKLVVILFLKVAIAVAMNWLSLHPDELHEGLRSRSKLNLVRSVRNMDVLWRLLLSLCNLEEF